MPKLYPPKLTLEEVQARVASLTETEARSFLCEMLLDAAQYQTVLVCMASRLARTTERSRTKIDTLTPSFENELFGEIKTTLDA